MALFTNLQYEPSARNEVRLVAQLRQDDYQIPNCSALEYLQIDGCTPAIRMTAGRGGQLRAAVLGAYLQRATRCSRARSCITSSERITTAAPGTGPIVTTYHHSSQYEGGEESLRLSFSRNHLEVGVYGFAQQDRADFNLSFTDASSPAAEGAARARAADCSPPGCRTPTRPRTGCTFRRACVRRTSRAVITENATDPRLWRDRDGCRGSTGC